MEKKHKKKQKVESSKSGKISSTCFKIFMTDEKAGQSFYRGRSPRGAVQKIAVYNLLPGFRVLSIPKLSYILAMLYIAFGQIRNVEPLCTTTF